MPRQDSGVKVLEGKYCDKLRQIGAKGLAGYYGFTTIEKLKIGSVKVIRSSRIFGNQLFGNQMGIHPGLFHERFLKV